MKVQVNKGFDPSVIADYKGRITSSGLNHILMDDDQNTNEYAHFYFIGRHEGREVIYDAAMYTLRLQHESELLEVAEHRAAQHFPNFKKITYEEDENGNLETLDDEEEEIGLFMAEVIMELEEEGQIKVKEHVDVDLHADFGIALDIGLHIEEIKPETIDNFIADFNGNSLKLDPALYSFQTKGEEA